MSEETTKKPDKQPKWKRFGLLIAVAIVLIGALFTVATINESAPPTSTPVAKLEEQDKKVGGDPKSAPGAKNAGHSDPAPATPFVVKLAGNTGYSLNDMGITSRDSETIRVEIANFNTHDPRGIFLYYGVSPLGKTNPLGSVNELVEGGVVRDGARYSQKGIDAYNAWKALWDKADIKVVDKVKHLGVNTGVTGPDSVTYSYGVYGNDLSGIDVTYRNANGSVAAEHSVLFRCMQPTASDVPPGPKLGLTDNTKAMRTIGAGNPPVPETPETPCVDKPGENKCKPTPPEEPCKPESPECKPPSNCEDEPEKPECQEPEKVQRCDVTIKKIVTITAKEAEDTNRYKPVGDEACKEPEEPKEKQVCDPESGEIITVPESEASNYEPVDSPKCKPTEPEMVERCDVETKKIVSLTKEAADANPGRYKPVGSPECETTHDECPELEGNQPEGTECEPVELCPPGTDREGEPRGDKPCKTEPGTPDEGAEQQPVDENNPDDVKPTPGHEPGEAEENNQQQGPPCSGSSCGHDPTESGTGAEDNPDGSGGSPDQETTEPNGPDNPNHNPDTQVPVNPPHNTDNPQDEETAGETAPGGDPLNLFASTAKVEKKAEAAKPKAEPKKAEAKTAKVETKKVEKSDTNAKVIKIDAKKKSDDKDKTDPVKPVNSDEKAAA